MKKLMILGAGVYQLPAIRKAKEMGLFTIACSIYPDDPGMKIVNKSYPISTIEKDKILEIAKKEKIDAIMTIASEIAIPTVAQVVDHMRLPGYDYKTAITVTNKYLFRNFLKSHNIPTPTFGLVKNLKEALEMYDNLSKNVMIMKPVMSSGSRGVFKIHSKRDIIDNFENCIKFSFGEAGVILEELMLGKEVGGEALVDNNNLIFFQITNKYLNEYYVPIGHSVPSNLPLDRQEEVKKLVKNAIEALNINSGPLNFDVMITNDGPKIIELGGRLGGNCLPELMLLSTDIDTIKATINIAIGEKPNIGKTKRKGFYGVKIIGSQKRGILKYITPIKKMKEKFEEDIIDIKYDHKMGDRIEKFNQGSHRIGHIILKGNNIKDIENKFNKIDDEVNIKLKEVDKI